MLLRLATFRRNLPSIRRLGLLCAKSRGKLPVVWLHAASKSAWAAVHVVKRHGARVEGVVSIEVDIPRRLLRRNRRGLWYCTRDIGPGRFRRLISFAELAGPSADDWAQPGPLALAAG